MVIFVKRQVYRSQYKEAIRHLRCVQILPKTVRIEQEFTLRKEPLDVHTYNNKYEGLWSTQSRHFEYMLFFYDDGFVNLIRIEEDSSETIVGDTISVVVIDELRFL